MFNNKNAHDSIKEYLKKDSIVLDVRTLEEWEEGHSENAKHIVLTTIPLQIEKIKSWGKPIIAVCRSGGRSGQAVQFLESHDVDIINGGPWENVDQFL